MKDHNKPHGNSRPGQTVSLLKHYLPPALAFALGLAVTFYFFAYAKTAEKEKMMAVFEHEAQNRMTSVQEVVDDNILAIEALYSFYISSYEVERSEFEDFTKHLITHYRGIQALEWIPRIPRQKKEAYEEAARKDGLAGFRIYELDENGAPLAASVRDEYYPVYFVEPREGNENALGFDLGSSTSRLSALKKACDTGRITATTRIRLLQGGGRQFGVLVMNPVYHQDMPLYTAEDRIDALKGFVLGAFRVDVLLGEGIAPFDPEGVDMYFFDDSSPAGNRFLYTHISRARPERSVERERDEAELQKGLHFAGTVKVANRKWIAYSVPTEDFISSHTTSHPWWILGGGALFSSLLSGYLLLITGLMAKTKKQADEILEANELLEHEIAERQKAEDLLIHAQKMEAVGTLTAGIAHEYNNILTAIKGYSEFIQEEVSDGTSLYKYADIIQKSVERAQQMTHSLLAYSRRQKTDFEYININEVVKHIEALLEHLRAKDISLQFSPHGTDLMLMADRSQMEQVLMNLATNAIDAMPGGGTLSVSTAYINLDEPVTEKQSNIKPGEYALILVSDTGQGIPKEAQGRVFEPFFTTKDVGKGTGLGLSMAYGIIKKHGGYINVFSEPDKGTTFKIYLPLARPGRWE